MFDELNDPYPPSIDRGGVARRVRRIRRRRYAAAGSALALAAAVVAGTAATVHGEPARQSLQITDSPPAETSAPTSATPTATVSPAPQPTTSSSPAGALTTAPATLTPSPTGFWPPEPSLPPQPPGCGPSAVPAAGPAPFTGARLTVRLPNGNTLQSGTFGVADVRLDNPTDQVQHVVIGNMGIDALYDASGHQVANLHNPGGWMRTTIDPRTSAVMTFPNYPWEWPDDCHAAPQTIAPGTYTLVAGIYLVYPDGSFRAWYAPGVTVTITPATSPSPSASPTATPSASSMATP